MPSCVLFRAHLVPLAARLYGRRKYEQAIEKYTQAIVCWGRASLDASGAASAHAYCSSGNSSHSGGVFLKPGSLPQAGEFGSVCLRCVRGVIFRSI